MRWLLARPLQSRRDHRNKTGGMANVTQPDESDGDAGAALALRTYTRKKQAIATVLRRIVAAFRADSESLLAAEAEELLVKLAEDRFTLAVVGQYKRGKSSLINALVRRSLLPTGVVPLTSVITALRYGTHERLLVKHTGFHLISEAPLSAIADFAAEHGNPGNARHVERVWVETPASFLRRGLEFVDTPGVGSTIQANTRTTLEFVPRCDAVVFVTSVEAPFSQVEVDFLRLVRAHVQKCFVVMNKCDLVSDRELTEALDYAQQVLGDVFDMDSSRLFAVSCRGSVANGNGDSAPGDGMNRLRDSLTHFLAEGGTAELLASVGRRAVQLGQSDKRLTAFVDELSAILSDSTEAIDSVLAPADRTSNAVSAITEKPDAEIRQRSGHDWEGALRTRGCAACDHLVRVAFEFFCHFQFELSTRPEAQRAFASRGGFCALHSWQLAAGASPQGLSSGLPIFAERMSKVLGQIARGEGQIALTTSVADPRGCEVCRLLEASEREFLDGLREFVATDTGCAALDRSQGLCLRHVNGLLAGVPEAVRRHFLTESARRFEELAEDMRSYVLKRETLRRPLITGDEDDAYRRFLVHVFGDRRLCVNWGASPP